MKDVAGSGGLLRPGSLAQQPPPNAAAAFMGFHDELAARPPALRGELHVSDVVNSRGWDCDRYLQFMLRQSPTSPVDVNNFIMKALNYGTAFHQWVYNHLEEAVLWYYREAGYLIKEVQIEKEHREPMTDVLMTPDIVIVYGHKGWPGETCKSVYDIKTVTISKWKRRQTRKGYSPEREIKRQLSFYAQGLGVDHAAFLFGVLDDRPGRLRPDNHRLYQHPHDFSGQRLLPWVRDRLDRMEAMLAGGIVGEKTTKKSYCAMCPFQGVCAKTDDFLEERHERREQS